MRSWRTIYQKRRMVIFCVSFFFFLALLYMIFISDHNVLDQISLPKTKSLTIFFQLITKCCDWYFLLILTALTFLMKDKKIFKYTLINLGTITLLNQGLKFLLKRPRPSITIIEEFGYSFPSGHAMVGMAFYGLWFYLIWKSDLKTLLKMFFCPFLALLILFIGMSRIYLGVHYVSDILGGFLLSSMYLTFYTLFIRGKSLKKIDKEVENEKSDDL